MFIHIFEWPTLGKFEILVVKQNITKAYLLADPKHTALVYRQTKNDVSITLPSNAPDPIASVVFNETNE